jgi:hypothetical protein
VSLLRRCRVDEARADGAAAPFAGGLVQALLVPALLLQSPLA